MPRIKIHGLEKPYRLKPVEMQFRERCMIGISVSTDMGLSSREVLTRGLPIGLALKFISTYILKKLYGNIFPIRPLANLRLNQRIPAVSTELIQQFAAKRQYWIKRRIPFHGLISPTVVLRPQIEMATVSFWYELLRDPQPIGENVKGFID